MISILPTNFRIRKSIAKPTKKPQNCGFINLSRAICAIHELSLCVICCNLGKILKHFYILIYNRYLTSQIGLCSLDDTDSILLLIISNFSIFAFVGSA